jgi:hypothetical protein
LYLRRRIDAEEAYSGLPCCNCFRGGARFRTDPAFWLDRSSDGVRVRFDFDGLFGHAAEHVGPFDRLLFVDELVLDESEQRLAGSVHDPDAG